jgi:hypothetical protein
MEAVLENARRISEEILNDYEGTTSAIITELATYPDPSLILEILTQIDDEATSELPEEYIDKLEYDFVTQVIQVLLGKAFDPQAIDRVNEYFQVRFFLY